MRNRLGALAFFDLIIVFILKFAPYRRGGFFFLILPIDKVGW